MEQRSSGGDGGKIGDHPLVLTIWRHSCSLHGEHILVFGTDCPDTARVNARSLYMECRGACNWTTAPREYVYDISDAALAASGDQLMPWETEPKEEGS